ncbi:peptide deformylase [Clostridium luticellarii]|uniref:Peptide deformylase n=1 Tax=Clostridium luticellarii TaxID=1691940 RepID=A0A2T0BLF6_9CLOT|nr:peptide deformylase [Clostridium luticellarii]MCI1945096.1 peptide deformylase [Clostridium luticellarii]MCI1968589.1 peptide deformylase [Clostridium luticellarii]MCI1995893.1 peptide deformylase [Clostridium luticellarii]MCI2041321.1 peptide deformylase [Clostridium luticellarii]PRR84726.1 Peptide deformylase [Clostridium luticellarii]
MAVREILQFGDKLLKRVSRQVKEIDEETLKVIEDLKDTLSNSPGGVGLSAPQIGILKKIIVIDLKEEDSKPIILINPRIIKKIGRQESVEGCLSYPGYEGIVIRPKKIIVTGQDIQGNEVTYKVDGLVSNVFCHEIDHLSGILYTDRAKKIYKVEATD